MAQTLFSFQPPSPLDRFWSFAFLTMIYVRNRSWSKGVGLIAFTSLTSRDPYLSNRRVFGCPAYVHIDSSQSIKFSSKAGQGIFVGYAVDSPVWLVYSPTTNRVIRSRSVTFNESWIPSPLPLGGLLDPTSSSIDLGEPLQFLTAFDDFESDQFDPPHHVVVPHPPSPPRHAISARQQSDEDSLATRHVVNPCSRSERALAQACAASDPPSASMSMAESCSYKML